MKIGITCRYIYEEGIEKQFVNTKYLEYVESVGFTPIILPIDKDINELLALCDCFLLTGGNDLDPTYYHEENKSSYSVDKRMDELDFKVIEYAVKHNVPVLGICRGLQAINVYFKGTLHQDLENKEHNKKEGKQEFIIDNKSRFFSKCFDDKTLINSYHHQGIKKLGEGLIDAGRSYDLIEAIEHETLDIYAVQWHPERLNDEYSHKLINEFKKLLIKK
jgi:putative glutamine amidotransferase